MTEKFNAEQWVIRGLQDMVAEGEKAKAKLIASIERDPLYALRWATSQVFHEAHYAVAILARYGAAEPHNKVESLKASLAGINEALDRWSPERSTSLYSNATQVEEQEALRRLRETLREVTR